MPPREPPSTGFDANAAYAPPTSAPPPPPQDQADEALIGRSGANGILAVAILEFIGDTVMFFAIGPTPDPLTMGIAYGLALAFLGLYFWARQNAYPALIVALSLYVGLQGLAAVVDPTTIYKGIIVKVVILSVLVGAIRNIRSHRRVRQEYGV